MEMVAAKMPLCRKESEMKKSYVRIIVLILCLCLIVSGCGPTSKFESHVKKGEYQKAISFYLRDLYGKRFLEIESLRFLREHLYNKWTQYLEGKISENAFSSVLTTLEEIDSQLGLLPEINGLSDDFAMVKTSKESYAQGVNFMEAGNYARAIEAFGCVVPEDAENYGKAQAEIEKAIDTYESEILSLAGERIAEKDYSGAISLVLEGKNILGGTGGFEDFLHKTSTQAFVEQFEGFLAKNDSLSVLQIYEKAKSNSYIALSAEMTAQYTRIRSECVQDAIEKAEQAFSEGSDYAGAVAVLESAQRDLGVDPEFEAQQEFYERLYEENFVQTILAEAEAALGDDDEKDYWAAMEVIKKSLGEFPNSVRLNEALEYYEQYIPINLVSLGHTQKSDYIGVGTINIDIARDMKETLYNDSTVIYRCGGQTGFSNPDEDEETSIIYILDREYAKLSGTVYRPYQTLEFSDDWRGSTGRFELFGDGVLLYSATVTQDTYDAENFEVDLTGVDELKIIMRGVWSKYCSTKWPLAVATDLFLTRG